MEEQKILIVPIDSIRPDPDQPRKTFLDSHINSLAQSIKQEGFINEIEIDVNSMIVTGECRWRAAKKLNLTEVPIKVNETQFTPYIRLRRQMAENAHQSGASYERAMNPLEIGEGYARLIKLKTGKDCRPGQQSREESYGLIKEVASELGLHRSTVYEYLELVEQPKELKKAIVEKGLPRTYIREIEKAPEEIKPALQKKAVEGGYSSRREIKEDVKLAKDHPDVAEKVIPRQTPEAAKKESIGGGRLLTWISEGVLALRAIPRREIRIEEKGAVEQQLEWIVEKINAWQRDEKV